jgi:protein-disulfide isomerase
MLTTRSVVLLGALALFSGCNKEKSPALASTPGTTAACDDSVPSDAVLATGVNGQKITAGEIDKELEGQFASINYEAREKKYDARRQALENRLMKDVFADEAKKRGITEDQLLKTEVVDKITTPSDENLERWLQYRQQRGEIPREITLEQVKEAAKQNPQMLSEALNLERQMAVEKLFRDLSKARGVSIAMSPPRLQVEATGPSKGPENAPITIVEFSDFQCPYCSIANGELKKAMDKYPGKVRVVFRNFPLDFHKEAQKAAEAGLCAQDQGKFWELHDKMFANQRALQVEKLKEYAKEVGMDAGKFDACLDGGNYADKVKKDLEAGSKLGISGTPAFLVNGIFRGGALQAEQFEQLFEEELARK